MAPRRTGSRLAAEPLGQGAAFDPKEPRHDDPHERRDGRSRPRARLADRRGGEQPRRATEGPARRAARRAQHRARRQPGSAGQGHLLHDGRRVAGDLPRAGRRREQRKVLCRRAPAPSRGPGGLQRRPAPLRRRHRGRPHPRRPGERRQGARAPRHAPAARRAAWRSRRAPARTTSSTPARLATASPPCCASERLGAPRPTVVVKGGALRNPDGVAISKTGAIFVTDHGLGGRALKIAGSKVSTVAGGIRLGDPAGIALTLDETHLLVSSLDKAKGTAQVVIVDLASGATSTFDDVIGTNRSAGGLHRARAAVPMGWADVQRPGRIYRVDP